MKNKTLILFLLLSVATVNVADDFVDDLYYQPKKDLRQKLSSNKPLKPYYNKNVKEIIFLDDTTQNQHPDTVRAIIRYTEQKQ